MSDELTLRIGRRGAKLLLRMLIPRALTAHGDDRRYLESICHQLKDFLDKPPPIYIGEMKVISVDGVPVEDRKKDGR